MENDLQFERAEFTAPAAVQCTACQQRLAGSYFSANGQVLCAACAENLRQRFGGTGRDGARLLQAALFGVGAAVLGGAIYGAVMAYSGWKVGLISILVGIIVGKAVRHGSGNLGGTPYQFLAAVLTYAAIAGAYTFTAYHMLPAPDGADIAALIFSAYRLPFAAGVENILGILIISFGVYQAWQLNRGLQLEITGPHPLAPSAPATPPAGV